MNQNVTHKQPLPQGAPHKQSSPINLSIPYMCHLIHLTPSYFLASLEIPLPSFLDSGSPPQFLPRVCPHSTPLTSVFLFSPLQVTITLLIPSLSHNQAFAILCPIPTELARDDPVPSTSRH